MTPDDIIGGLDCVLFCFILSVFIAIAIWTEVQERRQKKNMPPFVDWDALLEEVQKEKEKENDKRWGR